MTFNKDELLEAIINYSEQMGIEIPNESVLEQIDTQYVYEPYSDSFILKVEEGFIIIPLAFPENEECELLLEQSYVVDIEEIDNILKRMKNGYDELLGIVKNE